MSYDIPLHVEQGTPEARAIAQVMEAENVTAQEAVLLILRRSEVEGVMGESHQKASLPPLKLTPDQASMVDRSIEEMKSGSGLSVSEVRSQLAEYKKEWIAKNQN